MVRELVMAFAAMDMQKPVADGGYGPVDGPLKFRAYFERTATGTAIDEGHVYVRNALDTIDFLFNAGGCTVTCTPGSGGCNPPGERVDSAGKALHWSVGAQRLMSTTGTNPVAAMMVIGDWAKGYLQALGFTEFGLAQLGTPFIFDADAFFIPAGAPNPEEAEELLDLWASVEGQVVFNNAKGSAPMRNDITDAQFGTDELSRVKYHEMLDAETAGVLMTIPDWVGLAGKDYTNWGKGTLSLDELKTRVIEDYAVVD